MRDNSLDLNWRAATRLTSLGALALVIALPGVSSSAKPTSHSAVHLSVFETLRTRKDHIPTAVRTDPYAPPIKFSTARALGEMGGSHYWIAKAHARRFCVISVPDAPSVVRADYTCEPVRDLKSGALVIRQRLRDKSVLVLGIVRDGYTRARVKIGAKSQSGGRVVDNAFRLKFRPTGGAVARIVVTGSRPAIEVRMPVPKKP
jgi:hypothetical protein